MAEGKAGQMTVMIRLCSMIPLCSMIRLCFLNPICQVMMRTLRGSRGAVRQGPQGFAWSSMALVVRRDVVVQRTVRQ